MAFSIVNIIQAMLAPGLMISACALLLLGVNNKYSLVVDRIRALDEEKRRLTVNELERRLTENEKQRLSSINMQVEKFAVRFRYIKNILISYATAIAFFICSSFFIGMGFLSSTKTTEYLAISLFLMGMISVFVGIIQVVIEARKGYDIVMIEIS